MTKKTVVIFESKYGATRKYAEWIAEELDCPVFERKHFRAENFSHYDIIIYGGGLYAGGVSGIKLLTENWMLLEDKKVILFTCGLAAPHNTENVAHIREALSKAISPDILNHLELYHFHGAIDYKKLSLIHRIMMAMLHRVMVKKDSAALTAEDKGFLETYGKKVDFTDKKHILKLVEAVKSF